MIALVVVLHFAQPCPPPQHDGVNERSCKTVNADQHRVPPPPRRPHR
jgi:hypothetical protein